MFTFCDGSKPFLLDYLQSEYGMFNEIVQYNVEYKTFYID